MRTVLVFPPAADPAHPPLGIACLAGHLRRAGRPVELLDLNLEAYRTLLSSRELARCAGRMEARLAQLEASPTLPAAAAEEYRLLAENLLSADYLVAEVEGALGALRDPATYRSRAAYAHAASLVRRGMELVSAAHYPVRWYPRGFSTSWLPTRTRDVLAALDDRRQNLFLPLVEASLETLAAAAPDVVGVSVNYYCQVIPGLTVAAAVGRRFPSARVVIGGGLLGFFDGRWGDLAPLAGLADAWVPYEGEEPLAALLDAFAVGDDLDDVPGVLRFVAGRPRFRPPGPPPDPRRLPPPDFDGLPLGDYLAPEPILPLLASRGCYWTRCTFCSHYHLFRRRFQMRTAEEVRREMDHLARRHGAHTFYLSDEAVPPRIARGLAEEVRRGGLPYRWFGESRFEGALDGATLGRLAEGGCRMLMFGLESAVPRVLERMEKGIDPEWVRGVLLGCADAGIRAFVMFFLGFPGETREEAEATLRFVEELRGPITHVAFSNFILEHRSPVYRQPARFGITEIRPFPDEDLKIYSEYRLEEGLSSEAAVALLEEARERPGLRPLIDLYLVSRAHLAFLPPLEPAPVRSGAGEATEEGIGEGAEAVAGAVTGPGPDLGDRDAACWFPRRAPDLVPRTLAFNLDEIRRLASPGRSDADQDDGGALERHPTAYLFSPGRERLVEVGDDGLGLLAPCDGRYSLADILAVAGDGGRGPVLDFYAQLSRRGLLEWEVRR